MPGGGAGRRRLLSCGPRRRRRRSRPARSCCTRAPLLPRRRRPPLPERLDGWSRLGDDRLYHLADHDGGRPWTGEGPWTGAVGVTGVGGGSTSGAGGAGERARVADRGTARGSARSRDYIGQGPSTRQDSCVRERNVERVMNISCLFLRDDCPLGPRTCARAVSRSFLQRKSHTRNTPRGFWPVSARRYREDSLHFAGLTGVRYHPALWHCRSASSDCPTWAVHALQCALVQTGRGRELRVCTIEPNVGVVPVPDPRFDALCRVIEPRARSLLRSTSSTSPGSCAARPRARERATRFLTNIRECDAIAHVVAASRTRTSCTSTTGSARP